jgi:sporulation protein YlmC with PRC-barrel domain
MKTLTYATLLVALATTTATAQAQGTRQEAAPGAQARILSSIPENDVTVTHWYKQNVYDPSDNKIGEIMDVLVDNNDGKVSGFIVGVGGFLGVGEKDVAVPYDAVRATNKNGNKWYLVMNTTKDALKSAKGYKYDRNALTWIPEESTATTGSNRMAPRPATRQ